MMRVRIDSSKSQDRALPKDAKGPAEFRFEGLLGEFRSHPGSHRRHRKVMQSLNNSKEPRNKQVQWHLQCHLHGLLHSVGART